jgi:replicative DNA helicase
MAMRSLARVRGSDGEMARVLLEAASRSMSGALPPHDLDAEKIVLGGCMLEPERTGEVELQPSDFYDPGHGVIFGAIVTVLDRGHPLDITSLANELRRIERLNTVGGNQYLGELTDTIPTAAHIQHHARVIRELAVRRRTIAAAQRIVAEGFGQATTRQFLEAANAHLTDAIDLTGDDDPVAMADAIQESFARIEAAQGKNTRVTGLETGFRDLDTLTAGLHPGQLIILAARPAMGKTSLALNLTTHAAITSQKIVLFVSIEMPRVELANRAMAGVARIDQARLRANMLSQDDMTALTAAAAKLFQLGVMIDDKGEASVQRVRAKARKYRGKLALIVIDYLQLMKASREMDSREREISEISRALKALAKELDVPIVALSQLNRSPRDERRE